MITRSRRVARNRRALDPSNEAFGTDFAAVSSVVATKLRLTFAQPIVLDGIPQVTLSGGAHTGTVTPTGAALVSPTVVDLDYLANVAIGDTMTIPSNLQGIRSSSGGFMTAQIKVLA